MLNLLEVITEIETKIQDLESRQAEEVAKIKSKYEPEIEKYRKALEVNLGLNEACAECGGQGWYTHVEGYESYKRKRCKKCNGTGRNTE